MYLREFFPDGICGREGGSSFRVEILAGCEKVFEESRADFRRLWKRLTGLRGLSSLIAVRGMTEDLGTLFAVWEDNNYITLEECLSGLSQKRMLWDDLRPMLLPLLSTVEALHSAGIIHGGISPRTVLVSGNGRLYLGGFTVARARCAAADLNAFLYDGYAAAEQYGVRQKPGVWSDVYALAAVIYRCLTGLDPLPAPSRVRQDDMVIAGDVAERLPQYVLDALIDAFQVRPENRTVEVCELRAGLMGQSFRRKILPVASYSYNDISYVNQDRKPYLAESAYFGSEPEEKEDAAEDVAPEEDAAPPREESPSNGGKHGVIAFVAVLGVILLAVGAYYLYDSGFFTPKKQPATQPSQTQSVTQVPDLIGKSEVEVLADGDLREQFSLRYVKDYSRDIEEGCVFAQSVAAGQLLRSGSELVIYVSLGRRTLSVPNVVGLDAETAKNQLEQTGFAVEITEKENYGGAAAGTVASQAPAPETEMKECETVTILIWGDVIITQPPTTLPPVSTTTQPVYTAPSTSAPRTQSGRSSGIGDLFNLFGLLG